MTGEEFIKWECDRAVERHPEKRRLDWLLVNDCPRWNRCNAPICPLDQWPLRTYDSSEPICMLMIDYVKQDGPEHVRNLLDRQTSKPWVLERIESEIGPIRSRHKSLNSSLIASSKKGIKTLSPKQRLENKKSEHEML